MEILHVFTLIISFAFLLFLGVPVSFSIGIATITTMLLSISSGPAFTTVAQRMATGLDSFALLAIPFFILSGQLMNRGGIARRLIAFAKVLVGMFPGGLAFVNIMAAMLFGSISGSAVASSAAIGGFMVPMMKKEGYDLNYSAAVNITSATTGLIIPPSNVLIVYSLASGGVSIGALFIAGYFPGMIIGLSLMAGHRWDSRRLLHGYRSLSHCSSLYIYSLSLYIQGSQMERAAENPAEFGIYHSHCHAAYRSFYGDVLDNLI